VSSKPDKPADDPAADLIKQLRAATQALRAVAEDWSLLEQLPAEDRNALHQAVAGVYHPDPVLRRQRMKVRAKEKSRSKTGRDDALLNATGIRQLRARPVFTTPNVFPPEAFTSRDTDSEDLAHRQSADPQHCYVCKQKYSLIHHFYDQLCPQCARRSTMPSATNWLTSADALHC
jgi:hypothetical protein